MKVGDASASGGGGPVPAGTYALEIVDKPDFDNPAIKDGKNSRQVSICANVIDNPEHEGSSVWQNFGITKGGLFYFDQFLISSGVAMEGVEMGDPYEEDEAFHDFLDSLKGARFMAELTLEPVYSAKQGKEIDVNKVVNSWPYEPAVKGDVPKAAKEMLGPKSAKPAGAKPVAKPAAAPPKKGAPAKPQREMPSWAKEGGVEDGEGVGEEIPI